MAGRPAPTLYLLHGDDELASSEYLARLRQKLGDSTAVSLNLHQFSGENLDPATLTEACNAAPFLSRRRLVVVRPASPLVADADRQKRLEALLAGLPPTTALVLVEPAKLPKASPLLRWAAEHPQTTLVQAFDAPRGESFVRWVRERARQLGGEIAPQAAFLLAELVGDDPRLADQELAKLLDYVDRERPIDSQDVERLTPFAGQTDVFAMVDALGTRDGRAALSHLHRLLAGDSPQYAMAMIIRQFRLLLLAREAMDSGRDPHQALQIHPYVVGKITAQARHFDLAELEGIMRRLLAMDIDVKTGKSNENVALDTLIAGLTT